MKTIVCATATAVLALSSLGALAQSTNTSVRVNGKRIAFEVRPQRIGNSTLVPLRPIIDTLGGVVKWEGDTETIWVSLKNASFARVYPGKSFVQTDGRNIPLAVAPRIVRGQTMVPTEFFQKALGMDTTENLATGSIALQTSPQTGGNEVRTLRSTSAWSNLRNIQRANLDRYNRNRLLADENYRWYLQQEDYNRYLNERAAWEQAYSNFMNNVPAASQGVIAGYSQGPSASPYVTFLYGRDYNTYLLNQALWQSRYQAYLDMLALNSGVFPTATLINDVNWQNYLRAREALIQNLQNQSQNNAQRP